MVKTVWKSKYFCGNKISDYGIENKHVDYATLAKAFDAVLNNEIMQKTYDIGYWEQTSGMIDNSEEIEELQEKADELQEKIDNIQYDIDEMIDADESFEDSEKHLAMVNQMEELEKEMEELENKIEELEEEQDYMDEIYQYYIVSDGGANLLEGINEIVFYNEELDMYIWGVTHWGTGWDYVLTDIKCNVPYENE